MNLPQTCSKILDQLGQLTSQLNDAEFTDPIASLSQATLGQHLRHTLEFFVCLESGFEAGLVNYDERSHDKILESDRAVALACIERIKSFVNAQTLDKPLTLVLSYGKSTDSITIRTNYSRELVYNIEHAVHHMALIKIGVHDRTPHITLPADFGVASSTVRYKEAAATATSTEG